MKYRVEIKETRTYVYNIDSDELKSSDSCCDAFHSDNSALNAIKETAIDMLGHDIENSAYNGCRVCSDAIMNESISSDTPEDARVILIEDENKIELFKEKVR